MKYFLDTEFIEHPGTIELISIGIVSEDGRQYYAINKDFNPKRANSWVKANVLNNLPPKNPIPGEVSPRLWEESKAWKSKNDIRLEIADFMECRFDFSFLIRKGILGFWDRALLELGFDCIPTEYQFELKQGIEPPEIWAEWGSYDWVMFCWIFGEMSQLPKGFPMRCRDIIQLAEDQLGIDALELPASLETSGNHNALLGAKTVKMRYEWLMQKKSRL